MKAQFMYTGFLATWFSVSVLAQNGHQQLRKGDKAYQGRQYEQAEQHYRQAEEEQADFRSSYNLGNAFMQQKKYEDAAMKYSQAAEKTNDPAALGSIYHNLGNAMFAQGNYSESIHAYKKALSANPSDQATLENMMLAKKRLRQEKVQQQQESSKNSEERRSGQSETLNDQKTKKSSGTGAKGQTEQQQKKDMAGKQEGQRLQEDTSDMSEHDADQLLEIMEAEEKRVQRKLNNKRSQTSTARKDW
jgi:Ca-activated chloride channel family protein